MTRKVIVSADSTCDIGAMLQQKYDVKFFNFHIQVGEKSYIDKIEISPEALYAAWREQGILPKTAAITPLEYSEYFKKWIDQGFEVVHINLGSSLSSAHQNCLIAAQELGHVYAVDSASLSSGSGHLVVQAGKLAAKGLTAAQIQEELLHLRHKTHASFVLDTLEFMAAGGRCSSVAAFGANLLKLKPCIKVDTAKGGQMGVAKKYRGHMQKVLAEYVRDQLQHRDDLLLDQIFITHSGSPACDIEQVKQEIKKYAKFQDIVVTEASGTIASHCGPRTLGVLYMTK